MLIGRVSELTGATRKAIRHYESIGLIRTPERQGSYRIYEQNDVMVIRMIRRAQTLGFSLLELKDVVAKKTSEDKFPIEMVSKLMDKKVSDLTQQVEELLLKKNNLKALKVDLIESFS